MPDFTTIIVALLGTVGAVGAGAGKHIVQMRTSRKVGVEDTAEAEVPEPEAEPAPSPVEGFDRLTERLDAQLVRMSAQQERDRRRLDHVEAWNVTLGDHVDVLENHIWRGKPPPPPPRPRYIPYADPITEE